MSNLVEELKKIKSRKDIPLFLNKIMAEKICEIGVREGKHLKYLLLSNVKEIIAIDIWKDTGIRTQNDNCYSQQELDEQYLKVSDLSKKIIELK